MPSTQKTFLLPTGLAEYVDADGGGGRTFTVTICAALLHFFAEPDEQERRLWFRAALLMKKNKLDWRRAGSWVAEQRTKESAA